MIESYFHDKANHLHYKNLEKLVLGYVEHRVKPKRQQEVQTYSLISTMQPMTGTQLQNMDN